ncbi:MAG: hypothetical protein H8E61_09690 [Bacteroidetes bacterium]|nr:hypothetical protein [Bacteroidota bacterium]
MKNVEDFRSITRNIVKSYESKVKTVSNLMRQVEQKVVEAYAEQTKVIEMIRDTLAANQNLRKRDYNELIQPIVDLQEYRKDQIQILMEEFCQAELKNVQELKAVLEPGNGSSLANFYALKKNILNRPRAAEAHLGELLKSFHQDQADLDTLLRRLLDKGEHVHLKDVRKAVRAFQADHVGDGVILEEILREFSKVKKDIGHQWEAVENTVGLRSLITGHLDDLNPKKKIKGGE